MKNQKYEFTGEWKTGWTMSGGERPHGTTLHRIRALKGLWNVEKGDLGGFIEKESNLDFSPSSSAWVHDDACVLSDAIVKDDARIYDSATVSGQAIICEQASVKGNAVITENARVSGNAIVSGSAQVYSFAKIRDYAQVGEGAIVQGKAILEEEACVVGHAQVGGTAVLRDETFICQYMKIIGGRWESKPLYIDAPIYPICVSSMQHVSIGCQTHTIAHWLKNYERIGRVAGFTEWEIKEYGILINAVAQWLQHQKSL